VNEFLETSLPNVFAAGNFLMVNDIVDDVTLQGEIAALSAVRALERAASKGIQWKHVVLGNGIRSIVPQKFSGTMDVKFYIRIKEPAENAYIEVPEIGVHSFNRVLRPPEMVRLKFSKDLLKCDNLTFQVKATGSAVKKPNIVKGGEGMATKSIICIVCPIGCQTTVIMDGDKVKEIQGALCSRGLEFIRQEATSPVRILFTVVPIEGASTIGVLPIRSDKPVPKQLLERSLKELSRVNVKAPIKVGDIIMKDLLGQGFNIIASRTVNS
jgi:CxxC motif-containing protein